MTRETIIRNRLKLATHNLMICSDNWLMTIPKAGCEQEHAEAAAEVEILKAWLKEFHRTRTDSTVEFVGHVNITNYGKTYDGKPLAESIEFEVDTGAAYLYGDRRILRLGQEVQDWFIGEDGRCGRYDIERERRYSRLMRITVDTINYIRSMEWAVDEEEE